MKQEVVRNSGALLSQRFYLGETAVDADGAVGVTVTSSDGTETTGAATSAGNGRYTYALAPQSEVDLLTVTWTGTFSGIVQSVTTQVEVMGGHYFALSELRAMPGLSDTQRFPTAKLAEARTKAQDEIEREVGVAFVERYGERVLNGPGCRTIHLRRFVRRLLSGTVDGAAYTTEQLDAMTIHEYGRLEWTGAYTGAVVLRFVHGYTSAPPTEIKDIALELARQRVLGWRSILADQTVDADDLGQQTPAGEARDRTLNQDRIFQVLKEWRMTEIGPVFA